MQYSIKSGIVSLEGLCQGVGRDFVTVHTYAFALLIFNKTAIKHDTIPETLLFDTRRMIDWQKQARQLTSGGTALLTMIRNIHGKTAVEKVAVADIVKHFADLFVNGDYNFSNFSKDLCDKLNTMGLLMGTGDRVSILKEISTSVENPDDAVYNLM